MYFVKHTHTKVVLYSEAPSFYVTTGHEQTSIDPATLVDRQGERLAEVEGGGKRRVF